MTLSEQIRQAYFEENLTVGEIMSMYKVQYWIVIEAIRKGPND